MWMCGGVEAQLQSSVTSVIYKDEQSASISGHFTPRKEARHPLDRKLGGPQSQFERRGSKKNPDPSGIALKNY
jgi:hypothetical protein